MSNAVGAFHEAHLVNNAFYQVRQCALMNLNVHCLIGQLFYPDKNLGEF